MDVGLAHFLTDYGMQPAELGRKVEERGFESLMLPEHTHIPVSRDTPYPGGGELPPEYSHTLDPFPALAAIAAVTDRIKIGTGVCLIIQRDPIVTAKEVATVDQISGGRFLFGIGGGWNAEEMEHHGTAFKTRFRLLRERILAMKEIWTKDEAEYHGQFVNFDKMWSFPKPIQRPHPPILMGGDAPTTFDRVLEYADGWMPVVSRMGATFADKMALLQRRAKDAGRKPVPVSAFMVKPDRAVLDPLEGAGVERAIFGVPSETPDKVLPLLDAYAKLIR
jgi:probable F420-dependent oxidoreductase